MPELKNQWEELPSWLTSLDPSIYYSKNYIVLDFETTNINYGHWREKENEIVLTGWQVIKNGCVRKKSSTNSEFNLSELVRDCNLADFIVAHNAQFELGWLDRCGFDIASKPVFCTQIAEYVISGNRQWRVGLDKCLERRNLGLKESVVSLMIKLGICPSNIPTSWLRTYCDIDVEQTHKLFLSQLETLKKLELLPVFFCRCMLSAPLADISTKGMFLNKSKASELYGEYCKKVNEEQAKLDEITGGINEKSTKQLREYLYEVLKFSPATDYKGDPLLTPGGEYSTNAAAMESLKPKTKEQRQFLKIRKELVKLKDSLSKYLRHFYNCSQENNPPILYGDFNQTVTQTHRLSSSGSSGYRIQFQNIDRRFKPIISCRKKGWWFSEVDYSQLEYRAAVDMAGDEAGLNDIINKVDAHGYTANIIFKKKWESARKKKDSKEIKKIRYAAKAHTFKPLYGGTSGTAAQKTYYEAFKKKHKGITAWQETNKSNVLRRGSLQIPSGLIFYWPDTKITSSDYVTNTPSICNYPVQSFATADIVPLGVTFTWHRVRQAKLNSFLVNTVHDSILAEVHPNEVNIYEEITNQAMVGDVIYALDKLYNYKFTTPLEIELEYTRNWGDYQETLER